MGCLQQYQAEKMVEQATWTSLNIKSWYSSKEGFVISLVGLQRNCLFWTLTTQPNDQFYCLHRTTNEIKQCDWRKAVRIDKSRRCCIPSWRCKATHIFSHSAKIIGAWLGCFATSTIYSSPLYIYSPDLAPSDYFLFRSLQNSLNDKNFNNDDDIKSYLIQFFANKNQFYECGIMMLPERWQKVIDQNGQHITE